MTFQPTIAAGPRNGQRMDRMSPDSGSRHLDLDKPASVWRVIRRQPQHEVRSVLRFNLSSEGLSYYFFVPHNEGVSREFVQIVCCFRGPENVGVITVDGSVLHCKRGARLSKLRNECLKNGLDRVWTF